jgi:hypothetical protein
MSRSNRSAFDASLELVIEHLGLWALAWPVRTGLVRDPADLAGTLLRIARRLDRFGSDVGGMTPRGSRRWSRSSR